MPKTENWLAHLPGRVSFDRGGVLNGKSTKGESILAVTRFGEFGVSINDSGDLEALFPNMGLMVVYNQEGKIAMAIVDVGVYLSNLSSKDVEQMPNGGENIFGLAEFLFDERMILMVRLDLENEERVHTELLDEQGRGLLPENVKETDFSKGITNIIKVNSNRVAMEIARNGDEIFIGIGETDEEKADMAGVSVSLRLDFEGDLSGDDPKKLQKLANKILLG